MLHNTVVCPYCCQWLHPDNHHVRLRPKQRPSARVQSVLLRKARGKRLSLVQKNLLCRFQKSSSVLVRRQTNYKSKHLIMCFTALQHIVQEYNGSENSKPRQHKVLYIKHSGPKEHKRKAHMYLQRIKNKIAPSQSGRKIKHKSKHHRRVQCSARYKEISPKKEATHGKHGFKRAEHTSDYVWEFVLVVHASPC